MPYNTTKWRPADTLTFNEVTFLQELAALASYDADNVSLSGGSGGAISVVDISSQFNGVLTTFTIPTYTSIKLFIITGWPPNGALRPTTDFTTPSGTTVALVTSQVSAPVSGTTGIILYTT